jgi:hypothetical protein
MSKWFDKKKKKRTVTETLVDIYIDIFEREAEKRGMTMEELFLSLGLVYKNFETS